MNPSVTRVAEFNHQRQRQYAGSRLCRLLADQTTSPETKRAVLTYVQPWSNAFQRMINTRVEHETDPALRELAIQHRSEELGHDQILARSRGSDDTVWDPVIETGASWFVHRFRTLPSVSRAVLAHLALEASSLTFSQVAVQAYPDDAYFELHNEADSEHLEMGYQVLRERTDWNEREIITLLADAWEVMTTVSDHIADRALADTTAT